MEKGMQGIMCRFALWEPLFEGLPNSYVGLLLGGALKYAKSGEAPDFENELDGVSAKAVNVAWGVIRADIDGQKARYLERMARRKAAMARRKGSE